MLFNSVMQKPPSIDIKFEHAAPALLDELFELDINVTSSESEPVEATLFVEIKNVEGAGNMFVNHCMYYIYNTEAHSSGRLCLIYNNRP